MAGLSLIANDLSIIEGGDPAPTIYEIERFSGDRWRSSFQPVVEDI
ncbi:hypothetical protein [Aliiglaciecola sp. M165]|nr:hypothetical protein [Aliiglaciecola sp. M165]